MHSNFSQVAEASFPQDETLGVVTSPNILSMQQLACKVTSTPSAIMKHILDP